MLFSVLKLEEEMGDKMKFTQKFKEFVEDGEDNTQEVPEKIPLKENLNESISYLKERFDNSADFTVKLLNQKDGLRMAVLTMEGLINKENLAISVLNPLMSKEVIGETPLEKSLYIETGILTASEVVEVSDYDMLLTLLMSGFAMILLDGSNLALAVGLQGFTFRGVAEPETEVVQRGSREGFVEPMRINMTLIRRRIKNPKLKFETMQVGKISKTDICLCYINGIVSDEILSEVKKRLSNVNLDTVMASGYLVPYLENKGDMSLFSGVGTSERPDTVCGKIIEGRVAIIVDGTPSVLIVPHLFIEKFQTFEDYSDRSFFATFTRWLKYIAFFVSVLTPGLYVAVTTFNPELFPQTILNKVAVSIAETPFSLMTEVILIHFIYEVMREAGLRLPQSLGHAVSIVGGLVIGETAVNAGLIGAPTLMIVAITAISSYVIPSLYPPSAILRLIFIFVGGIVGVWGVVLLLCAMIVNICAKKSFGVPFASPIAPFSFFGMRDVIVRASWKVLTKKRYKVQDDMKK